MLSSKHLGSKYKVILITIACVAVVAAMAWAWVNHVQAERDALEDKADLAWTRAISIVPNAMQGLLHKVESSDGFNLPALNFEGMDAEEVDLEVLLEALLAAYNTDPSTEAYLGTVEELAEDLGAGLAETLDAGESSAAFRFLEWCGQPANLVYRAESTDTAHFPGETVVDPFSNYGYMLRRDTSCANYQFRWEYEAEAAHSAPEGGR